MFWLVSTIPLPAGAGVTRLGRSWTRSARSAGGTGFGSGVGPRVVPMSDDRVRTRVRVDAGWIDFQDYFVRQQCRPVVHQLDFDSVTLARPQADITAALRTGAVGAVIVCPSNPF